MYLSFFKESFSLFSSADSQLRKYSVPELMVTPVMHMKPYVQFWAEMYLVVSPYGGRSAIEACQKPAASAESIDIQDKS